MYRLILKKGYQEMSFIFDNMQELCEFIIIALDKAEEETKAYIETVGG